MKTRRRIRRAIRWSGVALTVLLLVVWVGSRWYNAGVWMLPTFAASIYSGRLVVTWERPWSIEPSAISWNPPNTNFGAYQGVPRYSWWFEIQTYRMGSRRSLANLHIPIWCFVLLTGVPTWLMWKRDRRVALLNVCRNCGYSRTGLPADRACPECGTFPPLLLQRERAGVRVGVRSDDSNNPHPNPLPSKGEGTEESRE